jgi:hypothetical protein
VEASLGPLFGADSTPPLRGFGLPTPKHREPTSGLEPLSCSLRVIGHSLQGCAGTRKCPLSKGDAFPQVAACCTELRPRWYQSGINITRKFA